jgi:hypothetical protein
MRVNFSYTVLRMEGFTQRPQKNIHAKAAEDIFAHFAGSALRTLRESFRRCYFRDSLLFIGKMENDFWKFLYAKNI